MLALGVLLQAYATAQVAVINKFFNSGGKSSGEGDIIELLVVQDKLDMRGMVLRDFAEEEGNFHPEAEKQIGGFRFANHPLWSNVRSGTLLVLSVSQDSMRLLGNEVYFVGLRDTRFFQELFSDASMNIGMEDVVMLEKGDNAHTCIHAAVVGFEESKRPRFAPQLYTASLPKKPLEKTSKTSPFFIADNPTAHLADFTGSHCHTSSDAQFGVANNPENQRFIDELRRKRK